MQDYSPGDYCLPVQETGRPDKHSDVFFLFLSEPTRAFRSKVNGTRLVKVTNHPHTHVPTPGVDNTEIPSFNGGPSDWMVVPEGTTLIPIIGQLLPQDNVEEIRTSLAIPEGCFTACPYGLRNGKPEYSLEGQRGLGKPDAGHRLPRRGQQRRYPVDPDASGAAARGMLGPGPV